MQVGNHTKKLHVPTCHSMWPGVALTRPVNVRFESHALPIPIAITVGFARIPAMGVDFLVHDVTA